jgi:hypothetical protein
MAKGKKKRSANRAKGKRGPPKAPPAERQLRFKAPLGLRKALEHSGFFEAPPGGWRKALEELDARAERYWANFSQTAAADRAQLIRSMGQRFGRMAQPAGAESAPAKVSDVKVWFAGARETYKKQPGERQGRYAKRLYDMQEAAGVAKPWPLKTLLRRLYDKP